MRNVKIENGLDGPANWPVIPNVKVAGNPEAKAYTSDPETEESVIRSWEQVAVLEVQPDEPCTVGFRSGEHMQRLAHPIETQDGRFGMRIGKENVEFLVIAEDPTTHLELRVVEITDQNDPTYKNLPLY